MGKHRQWRKIVKKERRRRIRTQKAIERDLLPPDIYEEWCKEQEELEQLQIEHIENLNREENEKWLQAETIAMQQWKKLQQKNELLLQKKLEQQARLKLEWEIEKQRKEIEADRLKEIEEATKKRQETFIKNLEKFLNGDLFEPPKELLILYESKPNCEACQFFTKTASCRFGDLCSRNHTYPGIGKILLATNMFGHFSLENSNFNEYDTDIILEYEESDLYKDFKDFFLDILPEFQKFGKVVDLKVCNNYEKHLRGNTYIEYADVRSAVKAYRGLHSRWYGGKQLSLRFCQLTSWQNAICGLQSSRKCPKGRMCNFLHVFKNPIKLSHDENRNSERRRRSSRSWRWSASPERYSSKHRDDKNHATHSTTYADRKRSSHRSPHRSRSNRYRH